MVVGLLLAIAGIGAACALIYKAVVYAVPSAVGVWAGFAALHGGSGPLLAIAIGFVTGAVAVALVFVMPAIWTGYCASQQIAELVTLPGTWSVALAAVVAVAVGITAFARLSSGSSLTAHHPNM